VGIACQIRAQAEADASGTQRWVARYGSPGDTNWQRFTSSGLWQPVGTTVPLYNDSGWTETGTFNTAWAIYLNIP
jgi:hypothetical protein